MILALDPATHGIGFGLIDLDGHPSDLGYLRLHGEGPFERQVEDAIDQLAAMDMGGPVLTVVIERVTGGRGVQSMLRVADAAGVTAGIAARTWPEATIWRPSPAEWKRGAGLKGNARKTDVSELAGSLAEWIAPSEPRQDALDALVMAFAEWKTITSVCGPENDATRSDLRAFEDPPKGPAPAPDGAP